jgi:Zn-finger nucleic acid-binding protein/ribosomal protein L40E
MTTARVPAAVCRRGVVEEEAVRLVACPACHAQFDVTDVVEPSIRCHCGATVDNVSHTAVESRIQRCGSCGASLPPDGDQCQFCGSVVVRDERRLSLICPECFARNTEESRFCTGCGIEFRPQAVEAASHQLDCPCCETGMAVRGVGGIRIFECAQCNGLWVPGENFDALIERSIAARRADPSSGLSLAARRHDRRSAFSGTIEYRRCPVCDAQMLRKNFGRRSGVIVDWCREHGTWLDADELEDIASFIVRGGLEQRAEPPATGSGHFGSLLAGASPDQIETLLAAERELEARRRPADERPPWSRTRSTHQHHQQTGGLLGTLGDLFESILGD